MSVFFYDPNIHPYEEYLLRMIETKRVCQELGIEFFEGEYDLESWMRSVKGLEEEPERGKRCQVCFDYRLKRSAEFAKAVGATHMTTTLLMSPKKDIRVLTQVGNEICESYGLTFISVDYRKGGGTQEMFRLSKAFEIYHQDYCGCVYGLFKQKSGEIYWDLVGFKGRRPGSKEEKYFVKLVRTYAESLGLPCKEWEFNFLNWRPLLGKLQVDGQTIPSYVLPYSQSIRGIVKADVEDIVGNTIYYNKQGLKVILSEDLEDMPLKTPRYETSPCFIVPKVYKDLLLKGRVRADLKTETFYDTSFILLMGSLKAQRTVSLPADTLQDGRGLSFEEISSFIHRNLDDILKGNLSVLLAGAESLGMLGSRYFSERTGKEVYSFMTERFDISSMEKIGV